MKTIHNGQSEKPASSKGMGLIVKWVALGVGISSTFGGSAITILGGVIGLLIGISAVAAANQTKSQASDSELPSRK